MSPKPLAARVPWLTAVAVSLLAPTFARATAPAELERIYVRNHGPEARLWVCGEFQGILPADSTCVVPRAGYTTDHDGTRVYDYAGWDEPGDADVLVMWGQAENLHCWKGTVLAGRKEASCWIGGDKPPTAQERAKAAPVTKSEALPAPDADAVVRARRVPGGVSPTDLAASRWIFRLATVTLQPGGKLSYQPAAGEPGGPGTGSWARRGRSLTLDVTTAAQPATKLHFEGDFSEDETEVTGTATSPRGPAEPLKLRRSRE